MWFQRHVDSIFISLLLYLGVGGLWSPASGQIVVPYERGDRVNVTVDASVTFDSSTGLYTYSYQVTSDPTSEQEVWFLALQFGGVVMPEILNVSSPPGWSFDVHSDLPMGSWGATEIGPIPPDFVDDGNVLPSPFQIKPGQTLGGFSFQSHDPPGDALFFAEGFTKVPQAAGDVEELLLASEEVLDFRDATFSGSTVGPKTLEGEEAYLGGSRPAVDGFLVFLNIADGDTRQAPVGIVVKFSFSGEIVDRSTFHAVLNGVNVTSSFESSNPPGDLTAVFALGSSPLKQGRNVLTTMVEGIVPGTNRTATDRDRLTFTVP